MARDIEEFLRKAAERRQQQAKSQSGAGQPPPPSAPRPASPPRQNAPVVRPQKTEFVDDSEVEVVSKRQSTAERHIKSRVNTNKIVKHAKQLGAEVGMADEKLEAHLQKAFDHQVGQLPTSTKKKTTKSNAIVNKNNIIALIRSPQSFRQAFIVSELLKRPDFDI